VLLAFTYSRAVIPSGVSRVFAFRAVYAREKRSRGISLRCNPAAVPICVAPSKGTVRRGGCPANMRGLTTDRYFHPTANARAGVCV
jgi:hypothetical protein